jgi:hypothetical protein
VTESTVAVVAVLVLGWTIVSGALAHTTSLEPVTDLKERRDNTTPAR